VSEGTFGVTQTLTGVAAVLFLALFQQMPAILWSLVTATHKTFEGLVFAQFATCALAMLPAATVFGFNFPVVTMLIAKSVGHEEPESHAVGRAYAANTVGAIVGAIIVGFWLVPRLGSFRVVAFTAVATCCSPHTSPCGEFRDERWSSRGHWRLPLLPWQRRGRARSTIQQSRISA
jgi:MFS family permease